MQHDGVAGDDIGAHGVVTGEGDGGVVAFILVNQGHGGGEQATVGAT